MITAIIPAAGKPTNPILTNSSLPDAMIPINGKPVIGYILEDLLSRNITKAVIALHPHDRHTACYVSNKFANKLDIAIIYPESSGKGAGFTVASALSHVDPKGGVLVYLGDTIYKGALSFKKSFLVTSSAYEDPRKWCFVEKGKANLRFINKPQEYAGNGSVLTGIYFFKNASLLKKAARGIKKQSIEISDILEAYGAREPFALVKAAGWYDCGNIENYYRARIDFLRIRSFNSITYNELYGYVTKRSQNSKKLEHELRWFLNLPEELKIFTPRVVNHAVSKKRVEYSLEFYGYPSLADMFLFGYEDLKIWKSIISYVFKIHALFKKHRAPVAFEHFHDMYYNKTVERLSELYKDPFWKALLERDTVILNGKPHKNIPHLIEKLPGLVRKLYKKSDIGIIHGDLCLSNILFDPGSKLMKLIDPRGCFGKESIYGDSKYDLAKLRHSFCGNYDFIVSDLFKVSYDDGIFRTDIHCEEHHDEIAKIFDAETKKASYDIRSIKLIEALLFISMIPLHANSRERQLMMYARGVELLQEFI